MAITFAKKQEIVETLNLHAKPQKAVVLLSTFGVEKSLDAETNSKVRKLAQSEGVKIKVVKNTLISRIFNGLPKLTGPTYLAYLENDTESSEVTVPKIIVKLIENDFKDNFHIVGAVVNGEFLGSKDAVTLSKTPSLEESLAIIAGQLQQITAKIAISINEIPSGIGRSVNELSRKI